MPSSPSRPRPLSSRPGSPMLLAAGSPVEPLTGIPVGVKDLFDTAGIRTTCASQLFADRVPDQDADVVVRFRRSVRC